MAQTLRDLALDYRSKVADLTQHWYSHDRPVTTTILVKLDNEFEAAIKAWAKEQLPELIPSREERERWYDKYPDAQPWIADIRNDVIIEIANNIDAS